MSPTSNNPFTTSGKGGTSAKTFLPEDVAQRSIEGRSNVIALFLFGIVMLGVTAAFFVTNRQWTTVKGQQVEINRQFTAESKKIEQLKVLEAQKSEMVEKAEITAALIERVPRSLLLAELINRMPEQLTLTDLKLNGKRVKDPAPDPKDKSKAPPPKSLAGGKPGAAPAVAGKDGKPVDPKDAPPKPQPPKYEFSIELVGLAALDAQVADYHSALKQCPLLQRVDLVFSGEVLIDEVARRKFRIEATINPLADARKIEPLQVRRSQNGPASSDSEPVAQRSWMGRLGLVFTKPANHKPNLPPEPDLDPTRPAPDLQTTVPSEPKEDHR